MVVLGLCDGRLGRLRKICVAPAQFCRTCNTRMPELVPKIETFAVAASTEMGLIQQSSIRRQTYNADSSRYTAGSVQFNA